VHGAKPASNGACVPSGDLAICIRLGELIFDVLNDSRAFIRCVRNKHMNGIYPPFL